MFRQKTIVTRQRRNSNQIENAQTRKLLLIDKGGTLVKYREKLLLNNREETLAK